MHTFSYTDFELYPKKKKSVYENHMHTFSYTDFELYSKSVYENVCMWVWMCEHDLECVPKDYNVKVQVRMYAHWLWFVATPQNVFCVH